MDDNRIKTLLESLETILQAFIREHRITHEEYRVATDILIETVKAGEASLLFDVFLEAAATDMGNLGRSGSPEAIEGPFYLPDAPMLNAPYVMRQRSDEVGDILFFSGQVTDTDGAPLSEARIDLWQADALGLYSNIHPDIPDWNLRSRFVADARGLFEVQTIVPPPYEIPKAGPTGRVLATMGRHFFRPAHLHVKVLAHGFEPLTSQLYFEGDAYLNSDVAGAVRPGLVAKLVRRSTPAELAERKLRRPYYELSYDFVLARQVPPGT